MAEALSADALLRTPAECEVDFIVIGGFAVIAYGYVRATKDLDIVPDPSPDNIARLAYALAELNARVRGVEEFDDAELPQPDREGLALGGNFVLDTDGGRLDVLRSWSRTSPTPSSPKMHRRSKPLAASSGSTDTRISSRWRPPPIATRTGSTSSDCGRREADDGRVGGGRHRSRRPAVAMARWFVVAGGALPRDAARTLGISNCRPALKRGQWCSALYSLGSVSSARFRCRALTFARM